MPNNTADYTIVSADDGKTFLHEGAVRPPLATLDNGLFDEFHITVLGPARIKPPSGHRFIDGTAHRPVDSQISVPFGTGKDVVKGPSTIWYVV